MSGGGDTTRESEPLRVAVSGASGRLGSLICEVVDASPGFVLDARLTSASAPDAGAGAQLLVDASHPDASPALVERALRRGQRVVVGTSGWSAERLAGLDALVAEIPGAAALVVPNFSLGSVVATALARIAAASFDAAEIVEAHHPAKADSPSGTAVRTAEVIAEAQGARQAPAPTAEHPARGRLIAGIPVHSVRLPGVVARQEVRFGGEGEVLSIVHDTHSPDAYRAGIRAALSWARDGRGLVVGLEGVLGLAAGSAGSARP